ncbi:MAG: peptidase MA family metallohydrolase [Candidatus Omnitrophota bacterium]
MKSPALKFLILIAVFLISARCAAKDDPLAATMYNELGVKALNDGATDAAVSYLEQARKFNSKDGVIKKNLSAAYYLKAEVEYTKRDLVSAERYLDGALENDPDNVNAIYLMGEIKYFSQKLNEAKKLWERILKVSPDYKYAGIIREKLAKLDKEAKVEDRYRLTGMDLFDIRYSKEGARLSYNVRYYLQEAYRLLGQDFDFRPRHKIVVLISDREDFEYIGGWDKEVQGIYDGKIRLPLIDADLSPDEIRGLIWHEYTHLIVHDIAKDKAPVWLNEGLAYYEGFRYSAKDIFLLRLAVEKNQLILLEGLDQALAKMGDETQYYLACQESYSLANYLMKRYNKYKVREILELVGEGQSFELVIKNKLNINLKELERRWLNDLKAGKLY